MLTNWWYIKWPALKVRLRAMHSIWKGFPTIYGARINSPQGGRLVLTYMHIYESYLHQNNNEPPTITGKWDKDER